MARVWAGALSSSRRTISQTRSPGSGSSSWHTGPPCYAVFMSAVGKPVPSATEAPEVVALQKRLRGEPLTTAEEAMLARLSRKPDGATVPHAAVMSELADRQRRGE